MFLQGLVIPPASNISYNFFPDQAIYQEVVKNYTNGIDNFFKNGVSVPLVVWTNDEIDGSYSELSGIIASTETTLIEKFNFNSPLEFETHLSIQLPESQQMEVINSKMVGYEKLTHSQISESDLLFNVG